jgi:hypothetical protein
MRGPKLGLCVEMRRMWRVCHLNTMVAFPLTRSKGDFAFLALQNGGSGAYSTKLEFMRNEGTSL